MSDHVRMLQRPYFYDFALDGNVIYFSMGTFNALCRGDLSNDQVEILKSFPNIPEDKGLAYYGVNRLEEYMLFCPYNDIDDYLVYDLKLNKFTKLTNQGQIGFYSSAVWEKNEMLFIVSRKTAEIYKVDLQNSSVNCLSCKEYRSDNARIGEILRIDDYLYLPLNQKRIMVIFDMNKEEFTCFEYPTNVSYVATLCRQNGEFWTTGKDKKIYKWALNETKADEIAEIPDHVNLLVNDCSWFECSFVHDNALWFIPNCSDSLLKYDFLTGQMVKVEIAGEEESMDQIEEEIKNGRYMRSKYNAVQKFEDRVFFLSPKTRIFYEMDLRTGDIHRHDFRIKNIYNGRMYPLSENGVAYERNYADGLKCLLENAQQKFTAIGEGKKGQIGKIVYCHPDK